MSKSDYNFQRWKSRSGTSWEWRIFKSLNEELIDMYRAYLYSKKYTYSNLKKNKANWVDMIKQHFPFPSPKDISYNKKFDSLSDWSRSFNNFDNWIHLNALVSITSNLETYMVNIIHLALCSDIGVLYGVNHKIDGISILKYNKLKPLNFDDKIISCTKGDWSSRVSAYKSIFGSVPETFEKNISKLEEMRKIRNDVSHAFGRDIRESKNRGELKILPIKKLSQRKILEYYKIVWNLAKEIDFQLLNNHIGEYQILSYYHKLYPSLNNKNHVSMRAQIFKKKLGKYGDIPKGKVYCKGLIEYYDGL